MHIIGEHYHVLNRGAHKEPIFHDSSDYERFIGLLHRANDPLKLPAKWHQTDIWGFKSSNKLVNIFAYCLMPNHYHLGLVEKQENGIETFTRRVFTSYANYYNFKYKHSGTIFQGACKSKHVDSDEYLRYLIQYIHLNPYGIEAPNIIKSADSVYLQKAIEYSIKYNYSSYKDYLGEIRPQSVLVEIVK